MIMPTISLQFREQAVTSLFKKDDSKFVQLSFEPGQTLAAHKTDHNLAVLVLNGKINFGIHDEKLTLEPLEMLMVEPSVEHSVEALEKSTVLLVLTPTSAIESVVSNKGKRVLEHEGVFLHPELIEQIAPEIRFFVEDHIELCQMVEVTDKDPGLETWKPLLSKIGAELDRHFVLEEKVLFPRMAKHVGGMDLGPVARLIEEHRKIEKLHNEANEFLTTYEALKDSHVLTLLTNKMDDLTLTLLNHLGKEDSHLFPMASRLMTPEEKAEIAKELASFK